MTRAVFAEQRLGSAAVFDFQRPFTEATPAPAPPPVAHGGGRGHSLSATFLPRQREREEFDPLAKLRRDDAAIMRLVRQLFETGAFSEAAIDD